MIYNKTEKRHLGIIVLIQSVLLVLLLVALIQKGTPNLTTRAAETTFSDGITNDAKVCMGLTPEERPACAKAAGIKIGAHISDTIQRYKECLKFRPIFDRYCQLGLGEAQ